MLIISTNVMDNPFTGGASLLGSVSSLHFSFFDANTVALLKSHF